MKLSKKGVKPSIKPLWRKRLEAVLLYITELERCLDAANERIGEQEAELYRARNQSFCPCTRRPRSCGAGTEEALNER